MRSLLVTPSRTHPLLNPLREQLAAVKGYDAPFTCLRDQAEGECRTQRPDLVVAVVVPAEADATLDVIRRLRADGQRNILAAGPIRDPKLILRAMQAGADVYVDEADLAKELHAALFRIRVRMTNPEQPAQMIAVIGAAGGCGASTIAVNLAILIAQARRACGLVDLNISKGDLAPLLDVKPTYTLADASKNDGRLDAAMFDKLLVRHPRGVMLLAAPEDTAALAQISGEAVMRAIDLAGDTFQDTVVDVEDWYHDEQLHVLRKATRILVVLRLDFTAIRQTKRLLEGLQREGVPRDRIELVVNQSAETDAIPIGEAEAALKCRIPHVIPRDADTMALAANLGVPAAVTHETSEVVQGIARLVGLHRPPAPPPVWRQTLEKWMQKLRTLLRPQPPSSGHEITEPDTEVIPEGPPRHEPVFHPHRRDGARSVPA